MSAAAAIPRRRRDLNYVEGLLSTSSRVLITMTCVLRQGNRLNEAAFLHAVDAIAFRHPHLQSRIVPKDPNKKTYDSGELCIEVQDKASSQNPPSSQHVEIVDATTVASDEDEDNDDQDNFWKPIVEKEANIAFDMEGDLPLWKIVLIHGPRNDVFVVKIHHGISDATSCYILIHDILRFHQLSVSSQCMPIPKNQLEPLPLLPPMNQMIFPDGRPSVEDEAFIQRQVKTLQAKRNAWYPRLKYSSNPAPNYRHSHLYRDGKEEVLKILLGKCRENGVTVGSVLGAATFFAVAKMNGGINPNNNAQEHSFGEPFYFDFDMDVNLRMRLAKSLGKDHVGCHIGMMAFDLSLVKSAKFWDFVKVVHGAIQKGLEEKHPFHYLEVNRKLEFDLPPTPVSEKAWKANDNHVNDMNFSNVGPYPFSKDYGASVGIEKIYCTGSGWCPLVGAYVLLIPSVRYLNFSIVYETAESNHKVAKELLDLVVSLTEQSTNLSDTFTFEEYLSW